MSDINPDLAAQEVDEDLRRDQVNALWKAYGKYIIGAAVGVVLVVAGNEIYKAQKLSAQETNSAAFGEVVDKITDGNANAVELWAESATTLSGGYAALADFRLATAEVEAGNVDTAIAKFDAVASSSSIDTSLQQLAQLRAALLIVEKKNNPDDARGRFSALAIKGQPWYYTATEQIAFIDMQQGRNTEALSGFNILIDDTATPQSISSRARQFRDLLTEKTAVAVGDVENAG